MTEGCLKRSRSRPPINATKTLRTKKSNEKKNTTLLRVSDYSERVVSSYKLLHYLRFLHNSVICHHFVFIYILFVKESEKIF